MVGIRVPIPFYVLFLCKTCRHWNNSALFKFVKNILWQILTSNRSRILIQEFEPYLQFLTIAMLDVHYETAQCENAITIKQRHLLYQGRNQADENALSHWNCSSDICWSLLHLAKWSWKILKFIYFGLGAEFSLLHIIKKLSGILTMPCLPQ